MNLREDWTFRGLVAQTTDPDLLERLGAGGTTAYIGFDPSAASLHLGHLLQLCNLRRLQLAGNRPIALAGGGTGLIGDPSFKDVERPLLGVEELAYNVGRIASQLEGLLDFSAGLGPARALVLNNADWLTVIPLTEFLRDVGKYFTVNQMVAKETVRNRLERDDVGLSFTEFSYPLLQAYDFWRLNRDHGCTLQLGGSDQWGNISAGVEFVRRTTRGPADGITSPLLLRADGRKFGKTEGGNENVWLDPAMTRPFAMHQFLLNSDDEITPKLLRFFTFLDHETIADLDASIASSPQERRAQRVLANEVVGLVHGEATARQAERAGEALFSDAIADLDEETLLEVVANAPSSTLSREDLRAGCDPVDLLVSASLAASRAEARRFLDQGGVYVNNRRVEPGATLDLASALHDRYVVLRRGRRQMHLVVLT
ncbi:MAG: tyrosine--tRNA ligase [Acidobacteriota bacterium]|nr:tyrosine--tRNA ligase [Acidobacteriota bacterium]